MFIELIIYTNIHICLFLQEYYILQNALSKKRKLFLQNLIEKNPIFE